MTPIAPLISTFLREYMPIQKGCSPYTCETYAHAFRLLFIFASKRLGIRPPQICLEQIDAALILDFLAHIEEERSNCVSTRNGRLAAFKAFIRYVEFRVPSALAQARQIRAIPARPDDPEQQCTAADDDDGRHEPRRRVARDGARGAVVDVGSKVNAAVTLIESGCVGGKRWPGALVSTTTAPAGASKDSPAGTLIGCATHTLAAAPAHPGEGAA